MAGQNDKRGQSTLAMPECPKEKPSDGAFDLIYEPAVVYSQLGNMSTPLRSFISFRRTIISSSVILSVLTGFVSCVVAKDSGSSDFQGTWELVYQESGGKKLPDEKAAEMFHGKMVFKDNEIHYTVELPGFDFKFSYQLHSDQRPKGIDLKVTETSDAKGTGKTLLGIYSFEGDTLEICYNLATRPTEFAAAEGSDNVLIVLKKASASQ